MTDENFGTLVAAIALTGLLAVGLLKLYWRVGEWLNKTAEWDEWRVLD